jgi:hypothetical protein
MASPEQAAAPLNPLAVCEAKFSEAYQAALEGEQTMYVIEGGTEVACFFTREEQPDRYYLLHRPTADQEIPAQDLCFWLTEIAVELSTDLTVEQVESKMARRDFAIMHDGGVLEVGLLIDKAREITEGSFEPGLINLPLMPANFADVHMTSVPEREITDELLANLRRALPIGVG